MLFFRSDQTSITKNRNAIDNQPDNKKNAENSDDKTVAKQATRNKRDVEQPESELTPISEKGKESPNVRKKVNTSARRRRHRARYLIELFL